jgi:hypothetical protein
VVEAIVRRRIERGDGLRGDVGPVREKGSGGRLEEHVAYQVAIGVVERRQQHCGLVGGEHIEEPVPGVRRCAAPRVEQRLQIAPGTAGAVPRGRGSGQRVQVGPGIRVQA